MKYSRTAFLATLVSFVTACGGGTGGTGITTTPGPANALSIGVKQGGAGVVIVNGVTFNAASATITIDNTQNKTVNDLQDGMVLTVRGQINDDRITGVAQQIESENEVRGTVASVDTNTQSFIVVGQNVLVDAQTVFANVQGLALLVPNISVVEVSGLRDASNYIRATRVELVASGADTDELRGTINNHVGSTFTVNGITVDASTATIAPSGTTSDLVNGEPVEVHGSMNGATSFKATRVDREDLEDAQFQPGANDDVKVEGFVSDLTVTASSTTFMVNGQFVSTTASTNFQNGTATDLANNVEVEVEGHVTSGVLVADKIAFEQAQVILIGLGTVIGTVPGTGTLTVFGKNVVINSLTQGNSVTNGQRVEMHGFIDGNGNIVAQTVAPASGGGGGGGGPGPGGGGNDVVQAPVTAKGTSSVTVLDTIVADLSSTLQFSGPNGPLTLATFLNAITAQSNSAVGTLVKVKGTFTSGTIGVEEAELEN